jgi:hypothetical protein
MPDLRQALKDFVATANSGKYPDEATLISKFPELQGYDINALKDFVATANSGKYTNEDELFSKFPEFTISGQQPVSKKKVGTALPSTVGSSVSSKQPEEQDYFTGAFGSVLRGLDNIVPIGIGDFVDDMARSVAAGYRQGTAAQEADKLLLQGTKATPEQIQKFINANKNAQSLGASAEMQNYQKIYENEGKGFWGVVKGLANNPSIIPEVLTSSITAMATNTDALAAGAAGVGAGTAYGAGTGALAGGVGAIPGAAAGAIASVPYAFGLASSVVEMGSTFGELLQEELGGKEMTKENVKAILENPEKLNSIRNRAIARGAIIGTVDAFTGKLASGVGAKIVSRSAAKSATGAVTRGAATRAIAAGAAVEGAGGSLGEATARAAIGQEMDVSEIALEGIAELPGGIRSTIQARLAKPSYKVNGEKVSAEQVDEIINTMSPTDLAKTKIEIKNDYQGREFKIQDKIVTASIKEQVRQGNPELNEPSLNAITELEKDLKKLEGNTTQTGKDKAAAIRGQIKNIQENQLQEEAVTETIKSEQDAIQEQATDESVLRTEQPEMGLQQVGEGNVQPEVIATGTEETITPEGTQEVVSSKTRVNVAPFFNTRIETVQEAEQLRKEPAYQEYKQRLVDLATQLGIGGINIDDIIGGFKNTAGEDFVEISNEITFDNATLDQAEEFAAMSAAITPQVQEATIAAQYVNEGDNTHNANEYRFKVSDINGAMKALKQAGISNFSINETNGSVAFTDVFDFADEQLQEKMGTFARLLDENNINYEQQQFRPTESRYVDQGKRKEIIRRAKSDGTRPQPRGEGFSETVERAIQRDAEFQGTTPEEYAGIEPKKPTSGNRLFNEPIKAVSEIANRYYQRVFKKVRPEYNGTRKFDEANAKRIADAFKAMKNNPNNPKVKAAYAALAKETIDQYKAFLDAGYVVEINNEEPYANSQEMIDDLRNNKRIKIFSTESGFGEKPITDKQRRENPLLATTEFTDVNDQPLLVNDLFRAIHDFFGHAELGNSFGPKGEENAWNVHARMFSPEARKAMTTETRGQNSYVNFSGVNDRIEALREEARKLRSEGKEQEAQDVVQKIYEEMSFADQKIGLLPEEFYTIDVNDKGDVAVEAVAEPVAEEVVVEEEVFEPITIADVKIPAFNRENALFYEEDERETDSGRMSTYLSSVTVEATNPDEEPLGTITKITDEDKIFYFTAEDADGNELNLDGYETLGDAKKAIADSYNKIQKKEFDKAAKKKAKDKAKAEAKKAKAKAKAEPTVEEVQEDIEGTLDELLELDPNDETTLKKVSSALGQALKDIDKFQKENLGVNIALPVMKTIIQAVKALVDAGVALQEAIKRVAKDNNVSSRDVVNGINAVTQIAPIQKEYDALMVRADELIARQKRRGITDAKIVSNLDTFIRNSEVYKNANDLQKKIMEREARIKMGVGPKRSVSVGRVLGALKDITNITRAEKMLVIKRIRDLSRDAAKELAKEIREMAAGGKITAVQAANIIARFGKVNMLNEVSVSSFVDYMAKVFANAEYANKIDVAKSKLRAAKKNIVTKIGIADGLVGPLQRLFSINPTLIPDQYLDRYLELVDMFSARQAVLNLEEKSVVTKDVNDILNEIDNEQSKADELADRFNNSENKVFKDDELDYAASIKKMLDEKEIDEKEAETMRKYKEDIAPQVEETELTEEEAQQEKDELIAVVKASQVDGSELPSKDERDLAKEIARLIKTDALKGLTNTELKNLLKVIDNINNNYLPHYAQLMVEKMNAINNGKTLTNAIKNAKVAKFSGLYARIKSLITKKGAIVELIRRNPLFNIDQLFGDFKTKDIFNSVLNKAAEGEAKFSAELKKVQNILEKAEEKVAKSFKLDPNKTLMSKFKMMTYMIQLEFESNKGNKQVNPAANYLRATIKHIDAGKSQFGERDAEMLQDILDTYADADGNIDNEKLYKSFNQAEKDAINDIRGVNESLRDKAEYTAAIIRGDRINPLNNYVHLNVLHEHQPNDLTAGSAFITEYNDSMRPSTKAKSLIARTGKVSPLNFDVFASAQRGAKFVLMDYNLTEPIRTARKTINQAIANLEEEGRIPKQKRDIINAINSAFEEAIENLLTNSYVSTSIADDAIDYINKQGYRAILAGTGRFISELTSNIGFAVISDPKAFIEGAKYKGVIMSESAPLVMENVNSKQTNRIFPTDTLSGKLIDTSIIKQASGIKGGKSKKIVANKIQQIYNLTGKKYANVVELSADALISTPDKIIMRPMWFGSFANEFKKVSGKDVDFEKIAANDEKYMADNKEAIEQAKTVADERSVMTGATDNAFMGILKGTTKPNQSLLLRGFNNFNNFMTRFLIFEYVTARTAINAAIGNGSLTKKQGGALLGAVATRMMVYTLLTQMLGSGLMELAFGGEDEPEDEKSFMQKLGQSLASAFTSLTLGRDFGNASKGLLNYGVERANEKYLDFLREGDYDPYKDAIQYTIVPPERKGRPTDLFDYGINMLGSFGPAAKTTDLIIRKLSEPEKKEAAAIERQKKELTVRIPLEVLGNLGLVPLYKDVRKVVMKDMYKDLEQADENAENKKQIKLEKLQGYENESDMKRYDPELWEETFGPNSPEYDAEQAKKNIKKAKDSLERAMKDEMYNYTPKSKKGFGSAGFGSGKGKSKGGFGTSKFGQ